MILFQIYNTPSAVPDSVPSRHQEIEMLKSLPFDELMQRLISSMVNFAVNLAIAILVFYVGQLIIKKIYKVVNGVFLRRDVDDSLASFILSLVRILLYFILIVTVVGILGIETSSFLAIFASAGVAIGMALSGTLQNFAGGVLILLLKPYKVGDYVEAQGYAGTVREIQIFHTVITTPDNKSIIIPNGGLSTGSINNYSKLDYRRVDWTVSISYGDSVEAARTKILEILKADSRVVDKYIEDDRSRRRAEALEKKQEETESDEPSVAEDKKPMKGWRRFFSRKREEAIKKLEDDSEITYAFEKKEVDRSPSVRVAALASSSVDLKVTAWTFTDNYWGLFYDVNEKILAELPEAGVNFPFPQLDVHLNPKNAD
ncbi:MAG: mechanosensitive ion channel [Muribaculaceae bacterium]|nr:mechanosensitive ion channel [Muribaculaceae bacterium]